MRTEKTIRDYLLGRVSDETTLEGIEELLFTDEEFCSQVALMEDSLINDLVLGRLDASEEQSLRDSLAGDPERSFKLQLTEGLRARALATKLKTVRDRPSFLASLQAFFRQPMYAGAFAVFILAVLFSAIYLSRRNTPDELAELRSIYQQARPTETRISEFGYAPLAQLRGAPETTPSGSLRRIENSLLEKSEKNSNAQTHHALGVYYLTQLKYQDAIREFEIAAKASEGDAKIHNDLGAANFELAGTMPKEQRLEFWSRALEEFTRATEIDGNFLEALFNKALAQQQLGMRREAKESWTLYLQKDPSSPWAAEARKHLDAIEKEQSSARTETEVLHDFLAAWRLHDQTRALTIHNETKGLLKTPALALQLSRRYLIAKQQSDEATAQESLEALNYIGDLERDNSEFFFLN
ncbi:MAG TPA: hypothetical protein VIW64_00815 [Pyrinomonadaceae bacterium]